MTNAVADTKERPIMLSHALTVQQPYADLIVDGKKRVENRTWAMPRTAYGWVAIHAAKGSKYLTKGELKDHVTGSIVGAAFFTGDLVIGGKEIRYRNVEQMLAEVNFDHNSFIEHEHTEGPVCWLIKKAVKFSVPITCKGALGVWRVPDEVDERINIYNKVSARTLTTAK